MRFSQVLPAFLLCSILTCVSSSEAQRRNTPKPLKPGDVTKVSVTYKDGKKNRTEVISCVKGVPGSVAKRQGKLYFTSFKNAARSLVKSSPRFKRLNALARAGRDACRSNGGGGGGGGSIPGANPQPPVPPPPAPTPKPDHLSLEKFAGAFGPAEARILYNRFGFGGTPLQIQEAVATGLDATINRLLTFVPEPLLASQRDDIECDTWLTDDPEAGNQNRICNSANVNDFSRGGVRSGLLHLAVNSSNPFLQKLANFLMDERLSVSHTAARDCERHAIRTYVNNVYKAAVTGDYIQYMRDMNNDHLMHLRSLDGGTNRGGSIAFGPNENYAREFWELGTVGPTGLDGQPSYTDVDIAQAALVFTGWNIDEIQVNGQTVCLASFVPLFHSGGPRTIFAGTPHQAVVTNPEELLLATFRHPRAAEHLAEDIWKEFISPFATPVEIRELAQIIRNNNFNLLPVFRVVMGSKALYAEQSRNSLVKHPMDLVVGFIKTTQFPLYYRNRDTLLQRLEQQVLNPNTVFGWDVKYLSGQQLQIEWWNTLMDYFMNINTREVKDDYNWSYYDRFVADLHAAGLRTSSHVIDRVATDLNITLTPGQKAELEQMMNFYLSTWNCPAQCNGQPYRLIRSAYDTDPSASESGYEWNGQRRIRMLVSALMQLPQARLK